MPYYSCNLCNSYLTGNLKLLLSHIGKHHKDNPNFHVLCGITGCSKTYKNYFSFRNHLIRKHAVIRRENLAQEEGPNRFDPGAGLDLDLGLDHENEHDEDAEDIGNQEFNFAEEQQEMQKSNAICLLAFKEKGRVPQTVVDLFVGNTTQIVRNSVDILKRGVESRLNDAGLDFANIQGLQELFRETSVVVADPFLGIDKEPLQHQYYKANFNLVEPRKIILGTYHVKVRKGNKLKDVEKNDDAYYISILESLQQLLNDDSILGEIENPHSRDDDILSDFCDGEVFRSHPLFGTDAHALQLLLYFDEVEVCNPLGSRATKHKLAAFYYTLGNIKPENRSHMNAIQLLGLITNKNLKKYGIDPILQAFMSDLSELEKDDGYEFIIGGEARRFHGTVAYLSGDNLGSQFIGGFKQGSQAHRKCRVCMGDEVEIKENFHEDKFIMRTKENYNYQCERLDQGDHFKKAYGLNKRSLLNDSRYYHVIGGLPADAMHDILEGVLQYTTKQVLKVFIDVKKFFTLDELNRRIEVMDYGYHNDTNKPAKILPQKLASRDHSLKQHANQMWCLGLYLPLIIGDLVPRHDEHWELVCTLLQAMRIIFSPTISKDLVPFLQILIQSHHEQFQELFPDSPIIPKIHYMVHMPRIILQSTMVLSSSTPDNLEPTHI